MVHGSFLKRPTFNNPQVTERAVFFLQSQFQNLGPVLLIRSEKTFNHLLCTGHHPFGEADLSETNAAHRGSVSTVSAEEISTQVAFDQNHHEGQFSRPWFASFCPTQYKLLRYSFLRLCPLYVISIDQAKFLIFCILTSISSSNPRAKKLTRMTTIHTKSPSAHSYLKGSNRTTINI